MSNPPNRQRNREIATYSRGGVPHVLLAVVYGLTEGRISQIVKAQGGGAPRRFWQGPVSPGDLRTRAAVLKDFGAVMIRQSIVLEQMADFREAEA